MRMGGGLELIVDPERWGVAQEEGEELVQVEIAPRVRVRMRRSEAIARGFLREPAEAGSKKRKAGGDKMRRPAGDK